MLQLSVQTVDSLPHLADDVASCRLCPRLVGWREAVATEKRAAYRDEVYWGRGVPGFGDPRATVVVFGLAPAAHGANRTGRVFTGDRSGDWLFRAMHRAGLASQPTSVSIDDGLSLTGAWVTAAVKCAPPDNKPLPVERSNCRPYLQRELEMLTEARVVVCLGAFAYEAACAEFGVRPRPKFGHGAELDRPQRTSRRLLVPPQPAEHLHRQADRADARCGVRTRRRARADRQRRRAIAVRPVETR